MKEIKIYAPVDCHVKPIEQSTDEAFSSKALGDGIVIIPKDGNFKSPFENAQVSMVFETKHAYGFEVSDVTFLIHCGMDTVNLKGKPFKTDLQVGQKILKGENLFTVDLKMLNNENYSTETPIVFESTNIDNPKLSKLSKTEFKQGELITILKYDIATESTQGDEYTIEKFKSKYRIAAEEFVKAVGGKQNFKEVYNCMTRLRFAIIDKTKVNTEIISKNKLVKGVVWNGLELQVIIGGECYKVKDEILTLDKNNDNNSRTIDIAKPPISRRLLGAVAGIMAPNVPLIMGAGIISALYAIFNQIGITTDLGQGNMQGADMFSALMYILSKTGLILIGVFFCINTTKYFGGNLLAGALIGLLLVSRFYYTTGINDPEQYEFGKYIVDGSYGVSGWYLFSIIDYPIVIRSYEGSVLPFIAAGILCAYSDNWIKTWMPTTIDVVFRYALVMLMTVIPIWFILGPALSLIEFGMAKFISSIEGLPLGIGVAIFAFLWQPLVLTGVHVAVITTIAMSSIYVGIPSYMMPGSGMAVWGQVGAAMGVMIATKNYNLKSIAAGAIPGGLFGITEPIIYGVTLPKVKPFLMGCIGGAVGGIFVGALKIPLEVPAGQGVFGFLGYIGINQLWAVIGTLISIATACGLTVLFYSERIKESKYSFSISKKLKMILAKVNPDLVLDYKKDFEKIQKDITDNKKIIQEYNKYMIKLSIIENKILKIEQKEEKEKYRLYKIVQKLMAKKHDSIEYKEKLPQAVQKYNEYNLEELKTNLQNSRDILVNENSKMIKEYQTKVENYMHLTSKIVNQIYKNTKIESIKTYENGYWNAINSVDISFGYLDIKNFGLNKNDRVLLKVK